MDASRLYPDWWLFMKPIFDEALAYVWESLADGGVSSERFYASHKKALALFGPPAVWKKIFDNKIDVDKVGAEVIQMVESSLVGKAMFSSEMIKCARLRYQLKIVKDLKDVEHEDFGSVALSAFKDAMRLGARDLVTCGHKAVQKVKSKITFMGVELIATTEGINDEWDWRLSAAIKSNCVNSQQFDLLPWEALCFSAGEVPGARETCAIPEEHCEHILAAREASRDFLRNICLGAHPTLADMQKVILGRAKQLKVLDRSFELDLVFLEHHVEIIIRDLVRRDTLSALPDEKTFRTYKEVLTHKISAFFVFFMF